MASPSGPVCRDQLLCSICLDVFKEPVTTPCGHNYCKSCITDYWSSTRQTRCPLCSKKFRQRPVLRCNTSFRDMLEQLVSLSSSSSSPTEEPWQAEPGDVSCDICLPPKLKALKTCAVCLSSYCSLHLEPHQRVPSLKRHQLLDPTSNLEHRVCQKHNKMLELFCTTDQTCVCTLCLQDDHASHQSIPLERAFREEKVTAEGEVAQLKSMEDAKTTAIHQIQSYKDQIKKNRVTDLDAVNKGFAVLVDSLLKHRGALVELIEQKYKDELKPHDERVCELQKGITEIQQGRAKLEDLLQTNDPLQFLLNRPETFSPPQDGDQLPEYDPDTCYGSTVTTTLKLMETTLREEMEELTRKVQRSEDYDWAYNLDAVWMSPKDKLMMIQQNYAVDLCLDPDSAHHFLSVHNDGKTLIYNPLCPAVVESSFFIFCKRFKDLPFVLSSKGFSSSRFYFEVEISANVWALGVVRESFDRRMPCLGLPTPAEGAWLMSNQFGSGHRHFGSSLRSPQKVGVFVDYEKGEVSFYDVNAQVLVSSYRECMFNEPVLPLKSFLYGLAGVRCKTKLYPMFSACSRYNTGNLKICPVITH